MTKNQEEDREHFHEKLISILEPIEIDNLEAIILDAAEIRRTSFSEIFGWTIKQSSAINLSSTLLQIVEFVEEKIKNKGLNRSLVSHSPLAVCV